MTSIESRVTWSDVERLIVQLAVTGEPFDTVNSDRNRIAVYDRGRRLQLETPNGLNWIDIDDVQACWSTFEERGRITRRDVLEPGRCSAFMMALFARVTGVLVDDDGDETALVLTR